MQPRPSVCLLLLLQILPGIEEKHLLSSNNLLEEEGRAVIV
jgi:hypothetical protein